MTMSTTNTEIANRRPQDTWLQMKLSELDAEIADIADRNRLRPNNSRTFLRPAAFGELFFLRY